MKTIIFAAFAALFCFCSSCNTDTTTTSEKNDNSQEQKNIAASDVISKAFETGDVSGIDSVVSDDFIDHTAEGDMKGRDSLKATIRFIHASFKDMKMEKIREIGDDDYVFTWMRYTGTSDGSMGMAKGPYDMHAIEVAKFKDGKAVEHWNFMEIRDAMKMMQQPMDTGKVKK